VTGQSPGQLRIQNTRLFTALQEHLGLKLEPARGPLEVVVIDAIHRPTPD
jgi:uncharacterized protein (TIGR03435 family)